jgi:hypothetical protein
MRTLVILLSAAALGLLPLTVIATVRKADRGSGTRRLWQRRTNI